MIVAFRRRTSKGSRIALPLYLSLYVHRLLRPN
jgi:hypothetical protein